ncbi:putative quinone oxidoreductase YhfP [Acidimicrobiaceae bacterium]|nr:putative quinone oxidoreductase YhfP [Acidimicrobiaceae bacterium]
MNTPNTSRAFTIGKTESGWARKIVEMPIDQLGDGDVLVEVEYSGINFKDGLASTESGRIARIDPLIGGVDLAGKVVESSNPNIKIGDNVIAHGYDIGVAHHGGFSQFARMQSAWLVPMPKGLDARTAMMIGTAGYTAALSVDALEKAGLKSNTGPILVTGATGGVGSVAVGMLAMRGYEVVASTGKPETAEWLKQLGASEIIDRAETSAESPKPIERERWAGAIDCVGGATLAYILRTLKYGCSVAASGLTGGTNLPTSVLPFILRSVNLLGIDSVQTPLEPRKAMWQRIATDLKPTWLETQSVEIIGLDDLSAQLDKILAGKMRGRVLVDPRL